jgi:hypothetical protein
MAGAIRNDATSVGAAVLNSFERRGVLTATATMIARSYILINLAGGASDAGKIVIRGAQLIVSCVLDGLQTAAGQHTNAPKAWHERWLGYAKEAYHPAGTPDTEKLHNFALQTAVKIFTFVVAWDVATLLGGRAPAAYSTVLSYMGPLSVNSEWNGPLLTGLYKYAPDVVEAFKNFKYFV